MPNDRPFLISDEDRDSVFRTVRNASEIEDLVFHDSRHEAVTRLAKVFPNVLDLQRVTGHKNVNQLLTYYETSSEELLEQLNSATSKEETR